MDKSELIEATARKTGDGGTALAHEDVERVIDALFGTVERSGAIAEALKGGDAVTVLSFGSFHAENGAPVLRPDKAVAEFLREETRR
ncbi:HU family DNA-binding protein [Streptomyces minutiscleroticus]|uniref:DNA-binding protein n=1 Tax=Streptomyces minutiscleroticus TaxID=68238 RepID=A0A918NRS0_9ACTN|nr:HU family DNA-binding protein [Streptomyces minutiscleroticus]GGX89803.1 hypothetical protein GCM10010358_49700 [Streptomyces minutiscleroticus]